MSQEKRVLHRLKQGPLTQHQALKELGVQRLGARVYDLKTKGHNIIAQTITVENRFGDICRVAQYSLMGDNK
jgi:hypothetical protein